MGSVWLGSLPDVLRNAGLDVDTYPGWETRSRGSGGYDSILGIQVHHTASSGANPANEMAYMWKNAAAKPIGAIYLAPTGKITVGAAGATNTSGKGGPLATSRGTIPLDAGNRFLIAIEAANPGNGTPWPVAQQDAYVKMCAALAKAYLGGVLLVPGDCNSHFEWAPGRKTDPAGSSRYAQGANKWNMTQFRHDVTRLMAPPLPPPTTEYERIAVAEKFEFATAPRWDTRGFGGSGLDPGVYTCKLDGSAGKVGAHVNLTIVSGSSGGYASAWASGPRPESSKINWSANGQAIANEVSIPLASDGSFKIFIAQRAHIIVDLVGYYFN